MPTYIFKLRDTGKSVEITMAVDSMLGLKQPDGSYKLADGCLADRDISAEHAGFKTHAGNWPILSEAAGVHPDQVKEATDHARSLGVPTDFTRDGRAKFESSGHRKKFLKAYKMRDRNCFN